MNDDSWLESENLRLRKQIVSLERQVMDLARHNKELRDAVDALLKPASSELFPINSAHPSRA
jgi:cell division protein FtsB